MYVVIKSKAIISDSSADDETLRVHLWVISSLMILVCFLIELSRNKNVICDTRSKIVDRTSHAALMRHIVSDADDVIEFCRCPRSNPPLLEETHAVDGQAK